MDRDEDYFLTQNKLLEEKLDLCIHHIEARLDKLYERGLDWTGPSVADSFSSSGYAGATSKNPNPFSSHTYLHFKAPYIRDFRNFSGPSNDDVKQIRQLIGTEDIDRLIKNKSWSTESKQQLEDAVLDHYSQIHLMQLIKQKNLLTKQLHEVSTRNRADDIEQKMNLIEEQTEQVKARKEPRIFVPDNRIDPNIEWCAISARLASTHHDAQDCRLMWSNQLHWSINNGLWTKEEDDCLLKAVQKFGKHDWDSVARELNSNRLPWQCCSRYQQEFTSVCFGSAPMNEDDIDKIVEVINLCRVGNFVPWNQVMYFVQYHSLPQVKYQWQKLLSERKSNEPWSYHEDRLLLELIGRFGDKEWNRIANYIPGRSNKSCRERYTMRLKFDRRDIGRWRRKEDEILLALIQRYGSNWSLISSHMPERNNHQLRSRYELLKNESNRIGPIKHRKLYRNSEGQLVTLSARRPKPATDLEVEEKLSKIFSAYQHVKSTSIKSLVCRSGQDEFIRYNLIEVLRDSLLGKESNNRNLLSHIIEKALRKRVCSKYDIYTPSVSTLRGYKAWSMQQDYLNQFSSIPVDGMDAITSSSEYHRALKICMSLFLWPAILSRIRPPTVDVNSFQNGSIIERDAKNLYKIRELQKRLASTNTQTI